MKAPIAAVIVSYRSSAEIAACLRSIEGKVEQIAVVDNAAETALAEIAASQSATVTLIVNRENRGFAAAVNQGVAATTAPYVLLLNPDCEVLGGLRPMVDCCRRDGVTAVGGLLEDHAGRPQQGFFARGLPTPSSLAFEVLGINRMWPSNPANRHYRRLDMDPNIEQEVEQPAGAFLLVRREALEAVGGLDEAFHPIWFEDVDLCLRLRRAGGSIWYCPGAVARHVGAHSIDALSLQLRQRAWYGSLLRFSGKHFSAGAHRGLRIAVLLGLALRRVFCMFSSKSSARSAAYGKTLQLVWNGFPNNFRSSDAAFSEASAPELS